MAAASSSTPPLLQPLSPPALAANMSRLTAHMRELYIHTLATALTERVSGSAGCNWEVPFSKVRGGLSKLCYECEPADDDVSPADSQCCLAHDVAIDPASGVETSLAPRELDGPFCHRQLWASCTHAVEPQCCDLELGAEARHHGSWEEARRSCGGSGEGALAFGSDADTQRWHERGEYCPAHHAGEWTPVNLWEAFVLAERAAFGEALLAAAARHAPGLRALPAARRDAMLRAMPSKVMGPPRLRRHLRMALVQTMRRRLRIARSVVDPASDDADADAAVSEADAEASAFAIAAAAATGTAATAEGGGGVEEGGGGGGGGRAQPLKTCGAPFVYRRVRAMAEGVYGGARARGGLVAPGGGGSGGWGGGLGGGGSNGGGSLGSGAAELGGSNVVLAAAAGGAAPSGATVAGLGWDMRVFTPTLVLLLVYLLALSHSPNPLLPAGPLGEYLQVATIFGLSAAAMLLPMTGGVVGSSLTGPCDNAPGTVGCDVPASASAAASSSSSASAAASAAAASASASELIAFARLNDAAATERQRQRRQQQPPQQRQQQQPPPQPQPQQRQQQQRQPPPQQQQQPPGAALVAPAPKQPTGAAPGTPTAVIPALPGLADVARALPAWAASLGTSATADRGIGRTVVPERW